MASKSLEEAKKMLANLDDPHGRRTETGDVMAVVRLVVDALVGLEAEVSALRARECKGTCCGRAGEYNGFGSDGSLTFTCPKSCPCHD